MDGDSIISLLKVYQGSERKPDVLADITDKFVKGIHPRIQEAFGTSANLAVKRILKEMFATPSRAQLCLDAMTQLCRNEQWDFELTEDCDLIKQIRNETHFISQPLLTEPPRETRQSDR